MIRFILLCFFAGSILAAPGQGIKYYQLGAGDRIKILVFEEADMSFDIKIDETGVFAYPYLGEVQLIGKLTEQLEKELTESLRGRVLVNPDISVSIVEYRPFSIGGEVEKPGSYPFQPGINVKKAINLAGGISDWGSNSRFTLERENKAQDDEEHTLDSPIYPGDTLTVLPRRF
jgi:polysaccharide export outer membrane protein